MTVRHDITPRQFADPDVARVVESTQQAIDTIPLISLRWVRGVTASGTAGTALPSIPWSASDPLTVVSGENGPPDVALIVRAVPALTRTADVGAVYGRLNFSYDAGQVTLYEPAGLTADAVYDLVVMFVGGVQ